MALYGLVLYVVSFLLIIPGISYVSNAIMRMSYGVHPLYDISSFIRDVTSNHADQCALYFSFFVMFVYWVIVKIAENVPAEQENYR